MLNAADALQSHKASSAMAIHNLKQPAHCIDFIDFKENQASVFAKFLRQCEAHHPDWIEVSIVKAAHRSYHTVLMDLAQRRLADSDMDVDAETGPDSRLQRASAALIASIWRLERRLHSMAD